MKQLPRRAALSAGLIITLLVTGCQRPNRLLLEQPFAPPAQREMTLTSDWGWSGPAEGGGEAVLLDFPLPGAVNGFRAFHVYLNVPEALGDFEIGQPGSSAAAGFFIQEVGDLKGKVVFDSGSIRVRQPWLQPARRLVEMDVSDESGFRLSGSVRVIEDDAEIRKFTREFAGDVAALRAAPTSGPAEEPASEETSPRERGAAGGRRDGDD